jgi:hypothetical protein
LISWIQKLLFTRKLQLRFLPVGNIYLHAQAISRITPNPFWSSLNVGNLATKAGAGVPAMLKIILPTYDHDTVGFPPPVARGGIRSHGLSFGRRIVYMYYSLDSPTS